jgi:hypothetical protein
MENEANRARSRLGFHYFPDTDHYAVSDLQRWLPELVAMNVSWLVLKAPKERAIPESFISTLVKNRIEPVLQFDLSLMEPPNPGELSSLLAAYANWGVHAVSFFDRPNSHAAWKPSQWALLDLVEQFLDRFIPYAGLALKSRMVPIFPTLEPGGNYWDTAFLRTAMESLTRRKQEMILQTMILSAYAWTGGHCLNWGAGGPDRWPLAKPYQNDGDSEDQRGFRIFDWYNAITKAVTGKIYPMILFQSGFSSEPVADGASSDKPSDEQINEAVIELINNRECHDPDHPDQLLKPLPSNVIASCFWLLADDQAEEPNQHAWFGADGTTSALVDLLKKNSSTEARVESPAQPDMTPVESVQDTVFASDDIGEAKTVPHPIEHYLLLPTYEWGIAEWHLDVIRPFIKKHRPTVGFSIEEAALAQRVTVIGSPKIISEDELDVLRNAGAMVERINGDGISIATKLAER